MLVQNIFSFSHDVFKILHFQGCQRQGLCDNGLNSLFCKCRKSQIDRAIFCSLYTLSCVLKTLTVEFACERIVGKVQHCSKQEYCSDLILHAYIP